MSLALDLLLLLTGAVLWLLGLQLFLRAELSARHKVVWTSFLILVGLGVGMILPAAAVRQKFLLLLLALPLLAAVDLALLKSGRTLSFWLRACGYEVCTVFGVAALTRLLLDRIGVNAVLAP